MKKLLLFVICILTVIPSCDSRYELTTEEYSPYKDYSFDNVMPSYADIIPEGFLTIPELEETHGIIVGFFESQIFFQDLDEVTFYQSSLSNSMLLVQNKNDLYINEAKVIEELDKFRENLCDDE